MNTNEKKKILAIDVGYSAIKLCYVDSYGALRFERIPNVIAKLSSAPTEMDEVNMFRFLDEYYILGPMALKAPRETHIETSDWNSLKLSYPLWISYLVKRYGGEEGFNAFDKIIIGLSLAFGPEKGDELLEYLYEQLLFPPGDENRNLFMILPQATSAKAAYQDFGLNIRETDIGNMTENKLKNYIILDIGQYSIDIASVIGSKSSVSNSVGLENSGTIVISYRIIDYIYQTYGVKISLKEANSVLETGGIWIRRRVKNDLSQVVSQYTKEYIRDVLNLLETKMSSTLDTAEAVLILGGGASLFQKYIDDPQVTAEIEKHFPKEFILLPNGDPDMYNVYSYYLLGNKILNNK